YLQQNASDVLAEKINNGVVITKDGKRLISKKDLNGFMAFASGEARKLAEKGANSACVEDSVVYGWAIHYFEEDSIEGTLYNEDGTEYQPPKPVKKAAATHSAVKAEPPKPKQQQGSLFDMLSAPQKNEITDQADDHEPVDEAEDEDDGEEVNNDYMPAEIEEEEPTEEEIVEVMEQEQQIPIPPPAKQPNTIYQRYLNFQKQYPDCVIVLRLGDFYEVFGQNAVSLAKDLDLTLTGRDNGQGERVPMIGVPHHASENYFAKMNEYGYKLAIVENVNADSVSIRKRVLRVDEETGEVLSEEEMKKFDGDIEEPKTPVLQTETADDEDEDFPPFDTKAFEPEALSILDELFGSSMILR
ncbi:MAG: Cas9 inhibitor AcrIIA9 family protein, partial [Lachnospiraceae bacterium]|nr:Cas9 inhibitor AcrIIA9 family protein [Lachnospiraceae bacterium]